MFFIQRRDGRACLNLSPPPQPKKVGPVITGRALLATFPQGQQQFSSSLDFVEMMIKVLKRKTYEESGSVVQEASEADGEGSLEDEGILGSEGVHEAQPRIRRQLAVPRELTLQLLPVFRMDQLVDGLMDHVRLFKRNKTDVLSKQ